MRAIHLTVLLCVLIILLTAWFLYLPKGSICPGVEAGNINLGGLNRVSANQMLDQYEKKILEAIISINYKDKSWEYSVKELGFQLNKEEVIQNALEVGKKGTIIQQIKTRLASRLKGTEIPLKWELKNERNISLKSIIDQVERPAQDAKLKVTGDEVAILPHQTGLQVDIQQLIIDLNLILLSKGAEEYPSCITKVSLPVIELQPDASAEDVEGLGIDILLGKYTTKFDIMATNRAHNIKTAAKDLEFYLLPPGEIFSFNDATGPKTAERGYKEAPVIVENQMSSGIGGGVCQVSSTLYNSALLANMTVVERRRHSLIVNYVPKGTDATVVDDYLDLQLKNNTSNHMLIKASVDGASLTIRIFGNSKYKKQVQILHQVLEVIEPKTIVRKDETIATGEKIIKREGKKGYKTKVMRIIRDGGRVVKEEIISVDTYPPEDRIVIIGQ